MVNSATAAAPVSAGDEAAPKQTIDWLKGLAAAVLFVEALLGVALPLLRGVRPLSGALNGWLLSLLNCFAGGVFITFGVQRSCLSPAFKVLWGVIKGLRPQPKSVPNYWKCQAVAARPTSSSRDDWHSLLLHLTRHHQH